MPITSERSSLIGKTSRAGVTMVELIIATSLLVITMALVGLMFHSLHGGFTASDAHAKLVDGSQKAVNRLSFELKESKRFFGRPDNALLALAQLGSLTPLSGSRLPVIVSTASVSPESADFSQVSVGNSLFFLASRQSMDLPLSGARIDVYNFVYFFLTEDNARSIGKQKGLDLWQWRSVDYADYGQIDSFSSQAARKVNIVKDLYAKGVRAAFDTTLDSGLTNGFYDLSSAGAITLNTSPQIAQGGAPSKVVKLMSVSPLGGFRWGVSPNTSSQFVTPQTVPKFAAASGRFPSGLEVVAAGPAGARQIFIRLVLAAEGSLKTNVAHEAIALNSIRDLW